MSPGSEIMWEIQICSSSEIMWEIQICSSSEEIMWEIQICSSSEEIMWEIQICSSSEARLRGDPSGSTMRAVVRAVDPLRCVDPRTPVLYSPAQVSPAQISPAQISPAQTTTCHASSRIRKRATPPWRAVVGACMPQGVPCIESDSKASRWRSMSIA